MQLPDIIIAVDGYSSTGKSTFARALSSRLGFLYLDSGALYRGVTLFAQEERFISGIGIVAPGFEQALCELHLHFNADGRTCMGARCIERQIRSMEVSSQVSIISALPYVRAFVDRTLHAFGEKGRVVMDGRDIGTAVFPDAQLKIFMVADESIRAMRRYDELAAKGMTPSMEDVVANLRERDYIDSHRETHPLKKADDAFVLDNSQMSVVEEVAWVVGLIQGKFGIRS